VDVGASPGGWCQRLAQEAGLVIATDASPLTCPHVLYDAEAGLPTTREGQVVHVKRKISDALPVLAAAGPVQMLTIDINAGRKDTLALLKTLKTYMALRSTLVLTVKLIDKPSYLLPVIREVQDSLRSWRRGERSLVILSSYNPPLSRREQGFGHIQVMHLFSNKRQEFTVLATKISESSTWIAKPGKEVAAAEEGEKGEASIEPTPAKEPELLGMELVGAQVEVDEDGAEACEEAR
jgi:hypothetical protein